MHNKYFTEKLNLIQQKTIRYQQDSFHMSFQSAVLISFTTNLKDIFEMHVPKYTV